MMKLVWEALVEAGASRGFRGIKTESRLRREYETGWGQVMVGLYSSGGVVRSNIRIGVRLETLEKLVAQYRSPPMGRSQMSIDALFCVMLYDTPYNHLGSHPASLPAEVPDFVDAHFAAIDAVAMPWFEEHVTHEGLLSVLEARRPKADWLDSVYDGPRHVALLSILGRGEEAPEVWQDYRLRIMRRVEKAGSMGPELASDLAAADRLAEDVKETVGR